MTALPRGRQGSLLALGITLVVALALWIGVAAPLMQTYADGAEALAQRQALARRMTDLVNTLPTLRRQVEDSAAGAPAPTALLEGSSDAVASAHLQELVQRMAQDGGIALNRVETLPVEPRGAYARIGLRVAFSADYAAFIRFLESIEGASPRMLVDELQVHSTEVATTGTAAPVDVTLSVFAFRPSDGGSEAK